MINKLPGLGSCASAVCKLQGNKPFTISKISLKSKPESNMAILILNLFLGIHVSLDLRFRRRRRAAAEPCKLPPF